ncbi:MAG: hypothetical protein ACK5NG_00660 [Chthoniobacterales bacterium]
MKKYIVVGSLLLLCSNIFGAISYYTDKSLFLDAIAASFTETFNTLPPPGGYININGMTIGEAEYNAPTNLSAISPGYAPSYYNWNSGAVAVGGYYGEYIRITPSKDIYYIGADVMLAAYNTGAVTGTMTAVITLQDSSTDTRSLTTLSRPNRAFMGFISSSSPVANIEFYTPDTNAGANYYPIPIIDNVIIPEPGVTPLFAVAGVVFLFNFFARKSCPVAFSSTL